MHSYIFLKMAGTGSIFRVFCKQVEQMGQYFKQQLMESLHRGAFELAYAGFVMMCQMLWK